MNPASICNLAGRYDNPNPPRFLAPMHRLFKNSSSVYTVKEKGGKPNRKLNPLPFGLRLRTLKIMPRNLNEIARS
jgi:hypothetical protein